MKVWPLCLFITPNIKSSLMNNLLARYFMQWARVYKNSKMNYENKYRQKYTDGRYSNIYYISSAYLNLTPASPFRP